MKADKFTKGCLLAIVVLLTMLLIKPLFEAKVAYAGKGIEYKVVDLVKCVGGDEEPCLNSYGREGWELITVYGPRPKAYLKR